MIRRHNAIALFLLLCSVGSVISVWQIRDWGDALSIVDSYSEANALREVRNFREHGLLRDSGLGNVNYPGLYPGDGFAAEPEERRYGVSAEGVYTHYPPGPEYLLYGAEKLFGPAPVSRLRLLPSAIGWGAMIWFGLAIRRRFGDATGWLIMGACAITPAVTNGFVGLHYQGYAFALLLVELGIAIGANARVAPFAVLGFLQGWLSFDYVFLVALTPVALELVLPKIDPPYQSRWHLALLRAGLAGGGFAAAHGLHFLQVWAYWGSLEATLRDFAGAAAHRAGTEAGVSGYLHQALGNLKTYFYGVHPFNTSLSDPDLADLQDWSMFRFLGLSLGPWWLLITLALMIREYIGSAHDTRALRMDWHFVSVTGLVTSSLWLVTMVNHGGYHRHFLFRHLFFAFFVLALFCAHRLRRSAAVTRRAAATA
jgi:hypothetical protein